MYAGVAWMLVLAVAGLAGTYGLHRFTAISPTPLTSLPFQSGWAPEEHALSRYHVRWYLATLVFLAFDVEMLFMYPWALVVRKWVLRQSLKCSCSWQRCSWRCGGHGARAPCDGSDAAAGSMRSTAGTRSHRGGPGVLGGARRGRAPNSCPRLV